MVGREPRKGDFEYTTDSSADPIWTAESESNAVLRKARFSATTIVTTSLIIAGGILGGAAFAFTHGVGDDSGTPVVTGSDSHPKIHGPKSAVPASSPAPSSTDQSTPSATDAGGPKPLPSGAPKYPGKNIAVPPVTFDDKDGNRDFHPAPGAPLPSGAPAISGDGDHHAPGEGDRDGLGNKGKHGFQVPGSAPTPSASSNN